MGHTNDRAYLATCRRFGITPSAADYDEFLAEAGAANDEHDHAEDEFHD